MSVDIASLSDDVVDCGSLSSVDNIWATGGAVVFWARTAALVNTSQYASKGTAGVGWLCRQTAIAMRFAIQFSLTPGAWHVAGPTQGTWVHIAILYDGSATANDPTFYFDAVAQSLTLDTNPTGSVSDDTAQVLRLGNDSTLLLGLGGELDDFRAYKRIPTIDEIALLAAGYRGPLGGEVVCISCDDFAGVTHPDGTTLTTSNVMSDLSGNGNDGVPTNSPVARASEVPRYFPWWGYAYFGGTVFAQALAGTLTSSGIVSSVLHLAFHLAASIIASIAPAIGVHIKTTPATDTEAKIAPTAAIEEKR